MSLREFLVYFGIPNEGTTVEELKERFHPELVDKALETYQRDHLIAVDQGHVRRTTKSDFMKEEDIPFQRRELIERLATHINETYDPQDIKSLITAAEDHGITVIYGNQVILPYYLIREGRQFILSPKGLTQKFRLAAFSHEFGHRILGHDSLTKKAFKFQPGQDEAEAEYFQRLLGNPVEDTLNGLELCFALVRKPITAIRSLNPRFIEEYNVGLVDEFIRKRSK